jgi:hypothetical protein
MQHSIEAEDGGIGFVQALDQGDSGGFVRLWYKRSHVGR